MKLNQAIFKGLDGYDGYETVFATRNYGYILAKHDETRLEGKDYIEKAERMEQGYPYWAERKLSLFVPVLQEVTAIEQ